MLTGEELRSPAKSGHVAANASIYRRGFDAALLPRDVRDIVHRRPRLFTGT